MDDFMAQPATNQLRGSLKTAERAGREAQEALEQARLKHRVAQANSRTAGETFSNWLSTRRATERAEQDPELVERTRALDSLKAAERQALAGLETQQQNALDANQGAARMRDQLADLQRDAQIKWDSARRAQELRVFLYRLALTLPLLVAAGWLFAKSAKAPTGLLSGALSSLRCSRFLWSWCLTCPATAVMCATSSASSSPCWSDGKPSFH